MLSEKQVISFKTLPTSLCGDQMQRLQKIEDFRNHTPRITKKENKLEKTLGKEQTREEEQQTTFTRPFCCRAVDTCAISEHSREARFSPNFICMVVFPVYCFYEIPWSRVLQNLIGVHLGKLMSAVIEPGVSWRCSQEPATDPHTEPHGSSPQLPTLLPGAISLAHAISLTIV